MQDAGSSSQNGGSLVFSSTLAGTSVLTDQLTIDSFSLATFAGSVTLINSSSTLRIAGNTVLGNNASQTLVVHAVTSFAATAPVTVASSLGVVGPLTANGNAVLGTNSSNTVTVNGTAVFATAVVVNGTLTARGNVSIGSNSSNVLSVNATSLFTAPASFSAGVALTTPVTVNGSSLKTIATSDKYSDLNGQPLFYSGSTNYSTAASGAPNPVSNAGYWYGTVAVNGSSGVATIYPTSNGTINGTALFLSILSVSCNAYLPSLSPSSNNAMNNVLVSVNGVASNLRSIALFVTTFGYAAVGGHATVASSGTLVMCTVTGTYA